MDILKELFGTCDEPRGIPEDGARWAAYATIIGTSGDTSSPGLPCVLDGFFFYYFNFLTLPLRGSPQMVSDEGLKLQVKTPSDYTYSLFWAELSRLLGEKNPCCYSGAGI